MKKEVVILGVTVAALAVGGAIKYYVGKKTTDAFVRIANKQKTRQNLIANTNSTETKEVEVIDITEMQES